MTIDVTHVRRESRDWAGYRYAGIEWPALWLPSLRAYNRPQPSARWHIEGEGYAQYFALTERASWAELVRYEGVRTESARCHIRCALWRMRIKEHDIADLSTFDLIQAYGLDPAQLVNDDHVYCRELAVALRAANFRGVLSPSAAYPGATNLTLFGPRRECSMDEQNIRPDHYIGCEQVADRAAPPQHVLARARYWGEPHTALYEWEHNPAKAVGNLCAPIPESALAGQ
jgi:hypothetical protein